MPLWTWPELCRALGLPETEGPDIHGISIDSRSIGEGDLFIALSGKPPPGFSGGSDNARDGHEFLSSAVSNGAAGVLVSEPMPGDNVPTLQVEDTFTALWQLAAAARARLGADARVLAITGSAGKTTMRAWLQSLLETVAETHASTGSLNNHWGVPLSMARTPASSRYCVYEVGTSNTGEIAPLSTLVKPHVSVALNVLPAHIGNFDSLAALRAEKLSIGAGLVDGGTLVALAGLEPEGTNVVTFGFADEANVSARSTGGDVLAVTMGGRTVEVTLPPGSGLHRAETALACLAVLDVLGVNVASLLQRFSALELPGGRGHTESVAGITIIDDSYNANPVTMKHALAGLASREGGRRIALLGEILELGDEGDDLHRSLTSSIDPCDEVITFGQGFDVVASPAIRARHADLGGFDLPEFVRHLSPGDTVLVKGSNRVFWIHGFVARLKDEIRDQAGLL